MIIPGPTNTPGVVRDSFRNHKFVRYNTLDFNGNVVGNALDACAGPHADVVPLETYLAAAIDKTASAAYVTQKEKDDGKSFSLMKQVGTYAPTESINVQSLFTKSTHPSDKGGIFWNTLTQAQGNRQTSTNPIGTTFTGLSDFLVIDIQVQTGPFDVELGKDRSTITVEFSHDENGTSVPFAEATIDVMISFDEAKLQAETRQFVFERDWNTIFAIPSQSQYLGDINMVRIPNGNLNAALIVYGNVVVYIEGDDSPPAQFDALVASFDKYMKKAMATDYTAANTAGLTANVPPETAVGDSFDVVITVR